MKNYIKFLTMLLLIAGFTIIAIKAKADAPPQPPPEHGNNGNVPGGGAPIGSGLFVLLGLGAAYGVKKYLILEKEIRRINLK